MFLYVLADRPGWLAYRAAGLPELLVLHPLSQSRAAEGSSYYYILFNHAGNHRDAGRIEHRVYWCAKKNVYL